MQWRASFGRSRGRSRLFFTLLGLRGVYKVFIALGAPPISDLFREKPSSRKALQEYVAIGSRAHSGGEDEEVGGPREG